MIASGKGNYQRDKESSLSLTDNLFNRLVLFFGTLFLRDSGFL